MPASSRRAASQPIDELDGSPPATEVKGVTKVGWTVAAVTRSEDNQGFEMPSPPAGVHQNSSRQLAFSATCASPVISSAMALSCVSMGDGG